jgi:hypothetical protein
MRAFLFVVVLAGCQSTELDPTGGDVAAAAPPDDCYLVGELRRVPSSGDCHQVEATQSTILVECPWPAELPPFDVEVQSGRVVRFKLEPGGCYRYYSCADATTPPTVTPCP